VICTWFARLSVDSYFWLGLIGSAAISCLE
jgi:hypothetical protein